MARPNCRKQVSRKSSANSQARDEQRWSAVVARDKKADGIFYYSVATTGVYCRPSCPSRAAKRSNVQFHETCAEAEAAGYRACKRCAPTSPSIDVRNAKIVASACSAIETSETAPSLHDLAVQAGLSVFHFHRVFRSATGLTPKAFAAAHRLKRLSANLKKEATVTDAIYASGFNSTGRFYAGAKETLGMTPKDYKSGGMNTGIKFAVGACSLGAILVAATEKGVAAILLGDDPGVLLRDLQDRFPKANLIGGDKTFERHAAEVIALVERPRQNAGLPLDVQGTVFQHKVWSALKCIPAGETASYADIAERIGSPKSVRAVASACGANAVAVLIPCHRVVRSDGALSGYRWGIERKRALLEREAKSKVVPPNKHRRG